MAVALSGPRCLIIAPRTPEEQKTRDLDRKKAPPGEGRGGLKREITGISFQSRLNLARQMSQLTTPHTPFHLTLTYAKDWPTTKIDIQAEKTRINDACRRYGVYGFWRLEFQRPRTVENQDYEILFRQAVRENEESLILWFLTCCLLCGCVVEHQAKPPISETLRFVGMEPFTLPENSYLAPKTKVIGVREFVVASGSVQQFDVNGKPVFSKTLTKTFQKPIFGRILPVLPQAPTPMDGANEWCGRVPHWHLLVYGPENHCVESLIRWWKRTTNDNEQGCFVTAGDEGRAAWYMALHQSKVDEQSPPIKVGRWWGTLNGEKLDRWMVLDHVADGVMPADVIWLKRLMRRKQGVRGSLGPQGFTWFLDRIHHQRVLAWCHDVVDLVKSVRLKPAVMDKLGDPFVSRHQRVSGPCGFLP